MHRPFRPPWFHHPKSKWKKKKSFPLILLEQISYALNKLNTVFSPNFTCLNFIILNNSDCILLKIICTAVVWFIYTVYQLDAKVKWKVSTKPLVGKRMYTPTVSRLTPSDTWKRNYVLCDWLTHTLCLYVVYNTIVIYNIHKLWFCILFSRHQQIYNFLFEYFHTTLHTSVLRRSCTFLFSTLTGSVY